MKALEFTAEVDMHHRLQLVVPDVLPGPVRVLVLLPETEQNVPEQNALEQEAPEAAGEADAVWMRAIAHEWREELSESREDIYTLEDGEPIHAPR